MAAWQNTRQGFILAFDNDTNSRRLQQSYHIKLCLKQNESNKISSCRAFSSLVDLDSW